MKTIKPSLKSRNDFKFFLGTDLDMIGTLVGIEDVRRDGNGYSALECWYQRDTHGEVLPCREIVQLLKAERGKQSWNLQVKMWAESIVEETLMQWELVDYCHGIPGWIFDATMQQAKRLRKEKDGWVPKFIQLHKIKGQWIPPWMLSFDPSI